MIRVENYPIEIKTTATSVYRSAPTITDKFADIEIHEDIHITIENELVNSFVLNSFLRLWKRCKKANKKLYIKCDETNQKIFHLVGLDKVGVILE